MTNANWMLAGGDTLLGRELRDYISEHQLPVRLVLVGGTSADRILSAGEEEATVMEPLSAATLQDAAILLLAAPEEETRAALELARSLPAPPVIIDLTGVLEQEPSASVRAPMLEALPFAAPAGGVQVVAHPAAIGIGRLLDLIHAAHPFRHAVATLFEPVSVHGSRGIDELHKQTLSLFNFQNPPRELFDAQASFNLLPRFGEEAAAAQPGDSQTRIERHLARFLPPRLVPVPSLRVLHAPVFHGYGASVWIEFENRPAVVYLEKELEAAGVDVRRAGMEPASNTGVAGQSGITVSDLAEDPRHGGGLWLWMMLDNLRTTAETAVLAAAAASRAREST